MSTPAREGYRGFNMNAVVGRRVHMLMWDRGETQAQVARVLGIAQSPLSKKLRGERDFDLNELMVIADHYKVSIGWLVRKPDQEEFGDPNGDDPNPPERVRHQGLEPRTRWLRALPSQGPDTPRPDPDRRPRQLTSV